jgi:hypothetical protein
LLTAPAVLAQSLLSPVPAQWLYLPYCDVAFRFY